MQGYLRAASRISTLAVGDPDGRRQPKPPYKVPRTASQMRRVEGAPFGTRGGIVGRCTTSRPTASTASACMLHSSRPGSCSAARSRGEQIEVSIDGERVGAARNRPRMYRSRSERHERHHAADLT